MHVVAHGNPFDGLALYGPYPNAERAVEEGDRELGPEYWVMELQRPPGLTNWERDEYQFPRLLAEIRACVQMNHNDLTLLCESMDLSLDNISELFDRAQAEWERVKAVTT